MAWPRAGTPARRPSRHWWVPPPPRLTPTATSPAAARSEEHTSELQSPVHVPHSFPTRRSSDLLGASKPVTVTANSSGVWSGNITINQVGPIELTVYGMASGGNPGEAAIASLVGTAPAAPYADGYFSGGG